MPVTVATQFKAWTIFALSNAGVMDSNHTQVMDVCVRLFRVYVVLYVGSGLVSSWSNVQGVLPTVYRLRNLKTAKVQRPVDPQKGKR
jgi:hypothetical protein